MMKYLYAILLLIALCGLAQAQATPVKAVDSGLQIVRFNWTKHRPMKVSLDTGLPGAEDRAAERMEDFQLDRRIAARRLAGRGTTYSEEYRKQRQLRIPDRVWSASSRPSDPGWSGYSYAVEVKNESAKKIEAVEWDYLFVEPGTNKELQRHRFASKVSIKPEGKKKVRVYTSSSPAGLVYAPGNGGGGESEKVEIKRVFYSDGSVWEK